MQYFEWGMALFLASAEVNPMKSRVTLLEINQTLDAGIPALESNGKVYDLKEYTFSKRDFSDSSLTFKLQGKRGKPKFLNAKDREEATKCVASLKKAIKLKSLKLICEKSMALVIQKRNPFRFGFEGCETSAVAQVTKPGSLGNALSATQKLPPKIPSFFATQSSDFDPGSLAGVTATSTSNLGLTSDLAAIPAGSVPYCQDASSVGGGVGGFGGGGLGGVVGGGGRLVALGAGFGSGVGVGSGSGGGNVDVSGGGGGGGGGGPDSFTHPPASHASGHSFTSTTGAPTSLSGGGSSFLGRGGGGSPDSFTHPPGSHASGHSFTSTTGAPTSLSVGGSSFLGDSGGGGGGGGGGPDSSTHQTAPVASDHSFTSSSGGGGGDGGWGKGGGGSGTTGGGRGRGVGGGSSSGWDQLQQAPASKHQMINAKAATRKLKQLASWAKCSGACAQAKVRSVDLISAML